MNIYALKSIGMTKRLLFSIVALLAGLQAFAQDPHFSQFYANPLYLNPAMAGSGIGPRFGMNFRDQWPNLPGKYVTYAASWDQHFDALSGGVGIQAMRDQIGSDVFTQNTISAMYANVLQINREWSLRTGFQASFSSKNLNWNNFIFGDQLDAKVGFTGKPTSELIPNNGQSNRNFVDFSAGIMAFSDKYFGGVAVHHLTQPNESLLPNASSQLPMKITIHGGAEYTLRKGTRSTPALTVSPNIIYMNQRNFNQLNIGTYITRGPVVGGAWYRVGRDFIFLMGLKTETFRIGYSLDVVTSSLRAATPLAHELSAALQFEALQSSPRKKVKRIKCPSF